MSLLSNKNAHSSYESATSEVVSLPRRAPQPVPKVFMSTYCYFGSLGCLSELTQETP